MCSLGKISHSGLEVKLLIDFEILKKSIYSSDVNIFLLYYCLKPQIIMTNIHIISKQRDPRMARSLSEFEFEDDVGLSKNSNVIIESGKEDD